MKKVLSLLLLLVAAVSGVWATEVEIGTGTGGTTAYFPTYEFCNYSLTQQIYTAKEIGIGGTINSIAFRSKNSCTRKLDVYMVHTTKSAFSSETDWVTPTSSNLVYSGDVTYIAEDWTTITLNTPFVYNGKDNLCLIVDNNTGSGVSSCAKYSFDPHIGNNTIKESIYVIADNIYYNINFDALAPTNYTGKTKKEKNQIKLDMEANVLDVTLSAEEVDFDGKPKTPAVSVKCGTTTLVEGIDYTVSYSNNTYPGTATVTVTGIGSYSGTTTTTFTINKAKGSVVFKPWQFTKSFGDPNFTIKPSVTGDGMLTYRSEDPTIVEVDEYTGEVTIIGIGTARLWAELSDGDYYFGDSDWYEVTVEEPDEVTITIGATGKSTFVCRSDVDFTDSEAEAYIAVGYNATEDLLTLGRIYKVPAGTPVLVKGKEGTYTVPTTSDLTYEYKDLLVGNTSGKAIKIGETSGDDNEFINHELNNGEFKPVDSYAYVPYTKAYLQLPSSYPDVKPGNALTITLPKTAKSTLCSAVDLDFSDVTGMKAYAATGYDKVTKIVTLTRVLKASAGTPLVIHGISNTTYTIPSVGVQTFYLNMLVGNNSGGAITVGPTSGSMTNYYLSSGEFKSVVDYATIPDGKCYLQLPESDANSARAATRGTSDDYQCEMNDEIITIPLHGSEATSMEHLLKAAAEQDDVYYNLNGQRTENPRQGIYLQKGLKVVIN